MNNWNFTRFKNMATHRVTYRGGDKLCSALLNGQMLLVQEEDVSVPRAYPRTVADRDLLLRALYDHHQCHPTFNDGDIIALPNGKPFAIVQGVHVDFIPTEARKKSASANLMSNLLMEGTAHVRPEVGMAATVCFHTDRHAGTITQVSKTGGSFIVQRDKAIRTDSNGQSDAQSYTYERDPHGSEYHFRRTARGYRCASTTGIIFGRRDEFMDPTF